MDKGAALIVFSDLDGTLLDHDTYDWQPARPALDALERQGALLVLSSSKTASEMRVLQDAFGLQGAPAIVENGAGVIGLPESSRSVAEYDEIRAALGAVPGPLRELYRGFGDLTAEEVAEVTGLPLEGAVRAKERHFSEPGLWSGEDTEQQAFLAELNAHGVYGRFGGRFLTLSKGRTKADAMADVISAYRPDHTIALGDAPNDIEMLEAADHGVIVANPHSPDLPPLKGEHAGRIMRTTLPGPMGWSEAVLTLLTKLTPR
ncbi:mannosyl-3-phosphoglycerate phosphatase [Cognatishimia sp. MH4019]|uniref:HAD-IIB family hydrolase n=1 Tax=Cognatishimia sp. MH4019 TaxID=2854030 RepID=UPI001CD1DB4E|nr:HAD-IIB family hydrolase [Cognatishimia sp. MH4019]